MPALRHRRHPRRRVRRTTSSRGRSRRRTLAADRDLSLWRYRALLPVPDDAAALPPPRLQVGFTPVVEAPALAKELGLGALFVKDDGRNPTASFKDRASSVGVLRARWLGRNEITCSSTGNAASSLAGFAAEAGMKAFIFVPASAPGGEGRPAPRLRSEGLPRRRAVRGRVPGLPGRGRGVRLVQPQLRDQPVPRRGEEDVRPRDRRAAARDACPTSSRWRSATAARRRGSGRGSSR